MVAKHVRFSAKNTVIPPPSLHRRSSYFTTSSPRPLPPSSRPHSRPPHTRHPSYGHSSVPRVHAHSLVAAGDSPLLNFDLNHRLTVSGADFLEPAVYPPRLAISIVIPDLPWVIPVNGASHGRYVAVADVLGELHRFLRTNITEAEFIGLETEKGKRRATEAYFRRCTRLQGLRGYREEKKQGMKRVDFLLGRTKFGGLSPTCMADVWHLHAS